MVDESREVVASSQIMEMLISDVQGDTEKGMWVGGSVSCTSILSWLINIHV